MYSVTGNAAGLAFLFVCFSLLVPDGIRPTLHSWHHFSSGSCSSAPRSSSRDRVAVALDGPTDSGESMKQAPSRLAFEG